MRTGAAAEVSTLAHSSLRLLHAVVDVAVEIPLAHTLAIWTTDRETVVQPRFPFVGLPNNAIGPRRFECQSESLSLSLGAHREIHISLRINCRRISIERHINTTYTFTTCV